jgi:GAF domain-containing protein
MLLLGADGVESFLTDVACWAAGAVENAISCGVTVSASGSLRRMSAASDEVAVRMDEIQYEVDDGPCLSCLRDGVLVRVPDLHDDDRWPQFCARGIAQRVGSSLSVPMMVGTEVLGAVNLYSGHRHGLDEHDVERATLFAHQAAGAVALAVLLAEREDKARNLAIALESRSVIDQAIGIVMAREHVNASEAFEMLRRRSQHANIKLRQIATDVVAEYTTIVHTEPPAGSGGAKTRLGRPGLLNSRPNPTPRADHDHRRPEA